MYYTIYNDMVLLAIALKHYNTLLKYKNTYYDYVSAIDIFLECANNGNAEAQYYLGECFYYGRCTRKDLVSATAYINASSEQGNSKAFCMIGIMMRRREFISPDIDYSESNERNIMIGEVT